MNKKQQVQGYPAHKWDLVDSLAVGHPYKFDRFSLGNNGTLSANQTFDYETDDLNDHHHRSCNRRPQRLFRQKLYFFNRHQCGGGFFDGDGIEDHNDTDIDGDGLTNAEEVAYNSDPWDVSSSNRPPTDINTTTNLTIAENSAIGSVIGEFNATDPDGEEFYLLIH